MAAVEHEGRTTTKAPKRPMDRVMSSKKPQVRQTWVALDPEAAEEYHEAKEALRVAQLKHERQPDNVAYEAEYTQAFDREREMKERLKECSELFVFRGIGRKAYDRLLTSFPATPEQKEEAKAQGLNPNDLQFDGEKFPPVLIHKSCISHDMSLEQAQEMWEGGDDGEWNGQELQDLFYAALAANTGRRTIDLGNA